MTQCQAATVCNVAGGWDLCTATQYLKRGGATSSKNYVLWLKACVRETTLLTSPQNNPCGKCSSEPTVIVAATWLCTGAASLQSGKRYLGVVTNKACRRVGQNLPTNGAMWTIKESSTSLLGALCCHSP